MPTEKNNGSVDTCPNLSAGTAEKSVSALKGEQIPLRFLQTRKKLYTHKQPVLH